MGFELYNKTNLDPPFSDFGLRFMLRSEPISLLIRFQSARIDRNREVMVKKTKRGKIVIPIDRIDSFLNGGIMRNVKMIMRA